MDKMRKVAREEVAKHEKSMHGKGKGYWKGGKTNADMLTMGRGMAKVNDQKTGQRKP